MSRLISVGRQNFSDLRRDHCFYVDKTQFIADWWKGCVDVTLITRPRRFGKTLMTSTVECFFSTERQDQAELFDGLAVWADETMRPLAGTIPVVRLSWEDVKGTSYQDARYALVDGLTQLYGRFDYLRMSPALTEAERTKFARFSEAAGDAEAQRSVRNLPTRRRGKKPLRTLCSRSGIATMLPSFVLSGSTKSAYTCMVSPSRASRLSPAAPARHDRMDK